MVDVSTGGVPEAQVASLLSERTVTVRFDLGAGELVESCAELARVVVLSCSTSGLREATSARDGLAGTDLPVIRVFVPTDGTPAAERRVRSQAANLVPNAIIHTRQDRLDTDARYVGGLGQLLRVGWLFVLVVAACSLTVGMVASIIERRRPFALLRASGLSPGELRQIVLLETAAAMLITAAVGLGLGLAASYVLALFGDTAWAWPDAGVFAMVGIGVLTALILSTMTLPLLNAATRHDTVRYE